LSERLLDDLKRSLNRLFAVRVDLVVVAVV
jgi:hypothetical protein